MRFDGPTLARAWRAVWPAAATSEDYVELYRAVQIEVHASGVVLTACDTHSILSAWVPALEWTATGGATPEPGSPAAETYVPEDMPPPVREVEPERVVVVRDEDLRAAGLLAYAVKLLRTFDKDRRHTPGLVVVDLDLDAAIPSDPALTDATLDGMDAWTGDAVALTIPDSERVLLPTIPDAITTGWPDWRRWDLFEPTSARDDNADPEAAQQVQTYAARRMYALHQAAAALGESAVTLLPTDRHIRVEFDSDRPVIGGAVMPIRDDTAPAPAVTDEDGP
ncbi:hypothetical protein [Nocardioides sp.]|uniref:hypothetical protein n=1 Tax=Nocardioides sp. TaxID=35761 RepID=UPI0035139AEF